MPRPLRPAPRTARLAPLALLACVWASCGSGGEPQRPQQRLLIIGWDGADFALVDALVAAGRLPTVAGLMKRGQSATLESTAIPISSAAWATALTGVGPGEHGVYGFFEPVAESYDVRLIDARALAAPPLWRILTRRGLRVHVFGVPLTWPPEPVKGAMVAGMLAPPDGPFTWPPALADQLRERGFVPDLGVWRRTLAPDRARVERQLALKAELLGALLARPDWDAAVVVFKSLDVVSHQVYDGRTDTYVATVLEELDGILERLVAAAGPGTNVVLVSDHGFRAYPLAFNLHAWLLEAGFAFTREGGAEGDPAPPPGPLAEQRPLLHRRRVASLDLARTQALASECEGNFGSLRLNLAGREPAGAVEPGEREAVLARLEAALRAYAPAGASLVEEVWRGQELYPGPHAARVVPDLVFRVRADHQVIADQDAALLLRWPAPRPDHARDGILVAAGPGIAPATGRPRWGLVDLAPSALYLLDQDVHAEMTGTVRVELARTPRPARRRPRAADGDLGRPAGPSAELDAAQAAALLRALAASGYTGGLEEER